MTDNSEVKNQYHDADAYRSRLVRLIVRLSIYYVCLFGAAWVLFRLFPGIEPRLPIGGLSQYAGHSASGLSAPVADLGAQANSMWVADGVRLFLAMLFSLLLMIPVSWVHAAIHSGHDYDHSIDETALILPSVVAGVVMVVQHSLALAFSLAGIVAGVRFRRALSDTFDTLFIFVAVGVGLAAGVSAIEIAVIITVFFNYATVLICIFGDGLESQYAREKRRRRFQRKLERQEELFNNRRSESDPNDTP